MKLYQQLTEQIATLIREGTLRSGDRAPSIRQLSRNRGASPATVVHAYELLQARGYLEARPRSGFFVSSAWRSSQDEPTVSQPVRRVAHPDVSNLVFEVLEAMRAREVVPLGSAFPSPDLFPLRQLARALAAAVRRMDPWSTVEDLPPGNTMLRRQIAQRYLIAGARVLPDEIVVTAGALEGLNLALQAVTAPRDIVAIESPSFYGCLQAVESSGRRAVEIPTHPRYGVDVDELERVLDRENVRACWFMTMFQNPLGATMTTDSRSRLVRLLASRNIPLIEDSVYTDLYFGKERVKPAKAFDRKGLVLDCGSFSKTLAPGYRLGWVAAGRFAPEVLRRKIMTSLATSIPIQAAIAHYLDTGGYERHLRGLRWSLQTQQAAYLSALERHFPSGTRWIRPDGGYLLWVELPASVDAIKVHRLALEHGISIAPGPIFSARREYRNFMRLNYGHPWTPKVEAAIRTIGRLIRECSR
ncbi:MAG: PLP-dependent aminotransferase family protein [Gammaproteobacteria bacterium]|nr:PLP-dependent aminotransferase family protein [Gammaproteobacteria bacterium]